MPKVELKHGWTNFRDDGEGPAIVFIHGMGLDLTLWDEHAAALSMTHRVLRLDTLGHGETERPQAQSWGFDDFADQIAGLLDARGVETATIVGFSLGGSIAQRFAQKYPARVRSLVIVASVCERSPAEHEAVVQRLATLEEHGSAALAGGAINRWFMPAFQREHPDVVARWHKRILDNDHACYVNAYKAYSRVDLDLLPHLGSIVAPTLILTGTNDQGQSPRMAVRMGELIPNSRVEIFDGVAHMLPLEARDRLVSLVREHAQAG